MQDLRFKYANLKDTTASAANKTYGQVLK